jgi:small-conductance mechanosensitive channel
MAPEHAVEFEYMNRPITTLRARVLSDSPAQRAATAEALLDKLVSDTVTGPISTRVLNGVLFISVGERDVLNLVPADLNQLAGETLEQRGSEASARLRVALDEAQEARRVGRLSRSIAMSLAATLAFALILLGAARLHRRAADRIASFAEQELDRVSAKSWWTNHESLIAGLARVVSMVALAILVSLTAYMWVQFVLRQFPYSRPLGETLRAHLFSFIGGLALSIFHAMPGLLLVAIIIAITRAIIGMSNAFFDGVESGRIHVSWSSPDTAKASRRIAATAAWLFAAIVAYPYLPGSGTEAFKGISVFVGLVISLGSSGLVNQLISGLTLTYSQGLRVGDVVRTGDIEGRVTRMSLLSVQLHTGQDELITAPNAVVMGQTLTNYTRFAPEGTAWLSTEVTIGYNVPWRQVQALLLLAADRSEGVVRMPRPRVWQSALQDFYVRYRLQVSIDRRIDRATALDSLLGNIQDAFNDYGVQILSPNYEADPEQPAIVPRSQWYAAPAASPPASARRQDT